MSRCMRSEFCCSIGMRRMRLSTPPSSLRNEAICASSVISIGCWLVKRLARSRRFWRASSSLACRSTFCDSALRASSSRLMVPFWLRYWL
ncbi:hypothetical protein D3C84_1042030 [compost metagenome]